MQARVTGIVLVAGLLLACGSKPAEDPEAEQAPSTAQAQVDPPREANEAAAKPTPPSPTPEPTSSYAATTTTINEFYGRGTPTFILATAGDDIADRGVATQVEMIRGAIFSTAEVVLDSSIKIDAGPSAWPANPVVYGGPHVSSLIAALELPFELGPGRLRIGDRSFEGDGYQVIAVIPASAKHPEFLLYAGTGTPGIAEINAVEHGGEAILVIDAFGRLVSGSWTRGADGLEPVLGEAARRIAWRVVERDLAGLKARFSFPEQLARADDEDAVIDAIARGISTAVERLAIASPVALDIYVHPDRRSKQSLTGDQGDGHAVAMASALHVIRFDPTPGGPLELLVAHEATHVLAHHGWGPAGTPFLGEGLAVYVSGQYGGVTLEQWAAQLDAAPPIVELLGPGFRRRPEAESYPAAGLLVAVAIEQVGLEQVREHIYGASAQTWAAACERAGTSAAALEAALAAKLGG